MLTLDEAKTFFRGLDGPRISRIRRTVLLEQPAGPDYRLSPAEFAILCLADCLSYVTPLSEAEMNPLLFELRDLVVEHVQCVKGAKDGDSIRPFKVGFADFKFATCPGIDHWWDVENTGFVATLPRHPIVTTAVDINALWFLSVKQAEQIVARRPKHADDTPEPEGPPRRPAA